MKVMLFRHGVQTVCILAVFFALLSCRATPDVADIAVSECHTTHTSSAIVRGELAGHEGFGEVGSLFGVGVSDDVATGGGMCSATLIAPDVVVTAAHCVAGFPQHRIRISTHACPRPTDAENIADLRFVAVHPYWHKGSQQGLLQTPEQFDTAQQLSEHCEKSVGFEDANQYWACMDRIAPQNFAMSGFIDAHTGDLAVAILDRPLQQTPLAHLPQPAEEEQYVNLGAKLTAVGYGVSGRSPSNVLHQGDRYAGRVGIDEIGLEEMRINFSAAHICRGDSGGPLLHQTDKGNVLLGVGVRVYSAHTMHAELCKGPGVATRTLHYTPWIRDTIARACQAGQRSAQMCRDYPI
jgi:hypothetical protein